MLRSGFSGTYPDWLPGGGTILAERKQFIRFSDADAELLTGLREVFEEHADEIVDGFYDHLVQYAALRPLLADPPTLERLKATQRKYLLSLVSGTYDEAYAASRLSIGRVHDRAGLEPQWYLGAYGLYLDLLMPYIDRHFAGDCSRALRTGTALAKLFILDMQLALDAYHEVRQKKAVERSEQLAMVGEMAASIAHEVRNPLAGMKGALEVLRHELSAKTSNHEIFDELLAQIVRLEGLVRDLLAFARPDVGQRERVDVHELLDRLLRYYHDVSDEAGVTVHRIYGPGPSVLHADPRALEQVLLNLIQNAVQAMEDGGTLTLATRVDDGQMTISCRDTGRGIPPEVLPHIFQPFYTTKHRGSGLGLSIVKKIVEQHGGAIDVQSAPGSGTAATLTMPLTDGSRV